MAEHTKTPWRVEHSQDSRGWIIGTGVNPQGESVYLMSGPMRGESLGDAESDAAFIVLAVNHHEELVEALKFADAYIGYEPHISDRIRAILAKLEASNG